MDIAVNLVESYLRLNGYLTLSEFEVQGRSASGGFETITDVDIMALRLPGPQFAGDPHGEQQSALLLIDDPLLELSDDLVDVILGEVKQGEAAFNPGLRRHEVLHSVLRRVEWLYGEPISDVVAALQEGLLRMSPAHGGGRVRTRLVAFGRSASSDLHTISHTHMVRTILTFFSGLDDAFKPVQFHDPALAMLSLLLKTGFEVGKP